MERLPTAESGDGDRTHPLSARAAPERVCVREPLHSQPVRDASLPSQGR